MCGIGGLVAAPGETINRAGLRRMSQEMAARGPDADGTFVDAHVGLVHRRLSILDLTPQGNCPMPNEDGTLQVVLNGEIYNWRELRAELAARGHTFRSQTDTEVVVHGYEAWGEELFARLRGMFAIALWDATQKALLLARDRVGEKPLYLEERSGRTVFASTIGACAAYDDRERSIDPEAIACYLAHGFVPASHTSWEGIEVFPFAHFAVVRSGAHPTFHRYWSRPHKAVRSVRVADAEERVGSVIEDSVRRCLDADVPVGVFLSGGVDSSTVAALAVRHRPRLQSFTLAFDGAPWSELESARTIATHLGLEHREIVLGLGEVLRVLPSLIWHYGQPFGDDSAVPTFVLSRLARAHVGVCLSGDGGDESFAGYWRARSGTYAASYASIVPERIRRRAVPLITPWLGRIGARLAALNQLSLVPPGRGYTNAQTWHGALETIAGPRLVPGLAHDRVACRLPPSEDGDTPLQRILSADFAVQLPDAFLCKVDVASMAASLEVRAPLLDAAVVETAWTLPDKLKLRRGVGKWLLRRIAARLIPREITYGPKRGFEMPLREWFHGALGTALEGLLHHSVAAQHGWLVTRPVLDALAQHRARATDHGRRLWLVLWLELWFRIRVLGGASSNVDLGGLVSCVS